MVCLFYFLSCYLDENSFLRKPSCRHCISKVLGSGGPYRSLLRDQHSIKDIYQALAMGEAVPVTCYRKCIHYYLFTKEALARSKATDPNLGEFVSRESDN